MGRDVKIGQEQPIEQANLGQPVDVDIVREDMFKKTAELEAFMADMLTIFVYPTAVAGALAYAPPQVNGVNCPIIRGQNTRVKRLYVEALARCRETTYTQVLHNANRLDSHKLVPNTVLSYPFSVVDDPHPGGQAWLNHILQQPT